MGMSSSTESYPGAASTASQPTAPSPPQGASAPHPGGTVHAQCPFCQTVLRAAPDAVNLCPTCNQQFSLQIPGSPGSPAARASMPTIQPERIMMHRNHPTATMQCTCPFCQTALSATARGLRASGGLMVCGQCHQQFNVTVPVGGSQQRITRSELLQLITLLAAGQQNGGPAAASQGQIEQLPTHEVFMKPDPIEGIDVSEDERRTCMVCLSEKEVGEVVRTLPCMHQFHKDCIDQWLKSNRTCPICKTDILSGIDNAGIEHDAGRDSQPSSPTSSGAR